MNDRGRLSRNPISVLVFIGLGEIAACQLVFGAEGSPVVLSMPHAAQVSFAWLLLVSCIFVLCGTAMPEPRAYWLEAGGKLGCAVALWVYTFTLHDAVHSWNTSMGFVFANIAVGCMLRLAWLTILILKNFYPRLYRRLWFA